MFLIVERCRVHTCARHILAGLDVLVLAHVQAQHLGLVVLDEGQSCLDLRIGRHFVGRYSRMNARGMEMERARRVKEEDLSG